ncbi:MAG: agmatine deiminase family protein [Hyphomonadaceae bacterium]|nr:agmatine deiminase family protein [Hyphomonadaceae bacterium]
MLDPHPLIPPEWAPQSAVWAGWPHIRAEWGDAFEGAREQIANFVRRLSQVTPVKIACGSREAYGSARFAMEDDILAGRISLHTLPSGDIWLRDTGPIIAQSRSGLQALQFQFNGWGGKYEMPGDTMTAGGIASVEQLPLRKHAFVLEGGAVDLDGAGRLLTTRECVLNPNRNPSWTQADAETALKHAFGVDQVIWLGDGLRNDHTDGHVDNVARFIGPGRVLCQSPSGADDPNKDRLQAIERDLKSAGLEVVTLPSPGRIDDADGNPVPASHMNFLISNRHVLLPVYEDIYSEAAKARLEQLLPGYKIIGLPARNILSGGGAFHCMTQQVPELLEA